MNRVKKKRLSEILCENLIITEEQAEAIKAMAGQNDKSEAELLIERGAATEEQIAEALSERNDIPYVVLSGINVPHEVLSLLDINLLKKNIVMPFGMHETKNTLYVAMADPMNIVALDDISILTRMHVEPSIATRTDIMAAIDRYYGNEEARSAAEAYTKEREKLTFVDESGESDVVNSPIVLLVNTMIEQAARQRASDIHVEALEDVVRVRYRIDGELYNKMKYAIQLSSAIIARIKILSGMDISEKRKPQDGRITYVVDRREYDIRVSTLPTVYGEKCVMRLAVKKNLLRDKRTLGFNNEELEKFDHILSNPNGIVLVTGPTGSGKSTTLYTALAELNTEGVNIITVEDPVEANIDGINQVQVNPKANLTFASALRSILRQDPDIIMVGEIRDAETALIATQASITGHLVVSTVHTNSAANTITRLMDMGIDSYLIADSVVGIIAQRLVRRLCPHCKKPKQADQHELDYLGCSDEKLTIYEPNGCVRCNKTGFYGRIGVYEIMEITPKIKNMISKKATADEIKNVAVEEGMKTLRQSAGNLVKEGITSFKEMLPVSFDE